MKMQPVVKTTYFKVFLYYQLFETEVWSHLATTGCSKKVLPFDKESNNSLCSVIKKLLDLKYLCTNVDFDSATTQIR